MSKQPTGSKAPRNKEGKAKRRTLPIGEPAASSTPKSRSTTSLFENDDDDPFFNESTPRKQTKFERKSGAVKSEFVSKLKAEIAKKKAQSKNDDDNDNDPFFNESTPRKQTKFERKSGGAKSEFVSKLNAEIAKKKAQAAQSLANTSMSNSQRSSSSSALEQDLEVSIIRPNTPEKQLDNGQLGDKENVYEPLIREAADVEPINNEPLIREAVNDEPLNNEPLIREAVNDEPLNNEPLIDNSLIDNEPIGNGRALRNKSKKKVKREKFTEKAAAHFPQEDPENAEAINKLFDEHRAKSQLNNMDSFFMSRNRKRVSNRTMEEQADDMEEAEGERDDEEMRHQDEIRNDREANEEEEDEEDEGMEEEEEGEDEEDEGEYDEDEEEGEGGDEDEEDEEDEEEEEEEGEGDEEEEEDEGEGESTLLLAATKKASAATKLLNSNYGFRKDQEMAINALRDAVQQRIDALLRTPGATELTPLACLAIDDMDEINEHVVSSMLLAFRKKVLTVHAQVFLAWNCPARKRYIVEDGRHRLLAIMKLLDIYNKNKLPEHHYTLENVQVMVTIIDGDKLTARIRKMSMERCNIPSVFEKIVHMRFVMQGLGMLDNPAMTMQLRSTIINEKIRGQILSNGGKGIAMYTIQAACLSDEEILFFRKNTKRIIDNCKLLQAYLRARDVNRTHAQEILFGLDGERNNSKLVAMHNNITELLTYKGYDPDEAAEIQDRIYKCGNAFSTIKRLVNGKNRLSGRAAELKEFLLKLERCLPPITFIESTFTIFTRLSAVQECTLHIFDEQEFIKDNTLPQILQLIFESKNKNLNFLVVGTSSAVVKDKLQNAIATRNTELRASQGSQMNRSITVPSAARFVNVGVLSLSVECAKHTEHTGSTYIQKTAVIASLLRTNEGDFLNDAELAQFANKLHTNGSISRTCLRLLSFNPDLEVSNTNYNSVFVDCSTPGPIAVAARCSPNRMCIMTTLSNDLRRELTEKQEMMKDDWPHWKEYKEEYTMDGKSRDHPGLIKRRKRRSKYKDAITSGLIDESSRFSTSF